MTRRTVDQHALERPPSRLPPGRQVLGPPPRLVGKRGERPSHRDRQSPDQIGEHRQGGVGAGVGEVCPGDAALNEHCAKVWRVLDQSNRAIPVPGSKRGRLVVTLAVGELQFQHE